MNQKVKIPRKLIEVALPLDAINVAAVREKSIRHGHPSTLHLWWARRPLAAARAVIFAQLVNDPGYQQGDGFRYGVNKKDAAVERKRLFKIIEELVRWENTTNEEVLEKARKEIRRSWREVCELNKDHPQAAELFNPDKLPALHDPFAGGGAIPLEAQRLGLNAYASDLNPVAVLINKAMIEIPPKFSNRPPVNQICRKTSPKKRCGKAQRALPRTYATTVNGCAIRLKNASATCTQRSPSQKRWPPKGQTETVHGTQTHSHCMAVGTHRKKPKPGLCACRCAPDFHLYALHKEEQRSLYRASHQRRRLSLYRKSRKAKGSRCRQSGNKNGAWINLPLPTIRRTNIRRLHQNRRTSRAHGRTAHGNSDRGRPRAYLSRSNPKDGNHRTRSETGVEARK